MALVAQKLGCDRSTVWRYANKYQTIRNALYQADEAVTDLAELKAKRLIQAEYWPAIEHRLSTKGKLRGYTPRQEITGADGSEITIKVVYDDVGSSPAEAASETA